MDSKAQIADIFAEFSRESGVPLELSPDDSATLVVGDVIVNLQYLAASESLLAWATVGFLGADVNAPRRVRYLLEKHDALLKSHGFAFSLDPEDDDRVLAHDFHVTEYFETGDRLAAWIKDLVAVVRETRAELAAVAPYVDDEPFAADADGEEVQ